MWRAVCVSFLLLAVVACQSEEERLAQHLERGEQLLQEERWNDAALEFKNAVQIDPNNATGHYGLARSYLGEGQVAEGFWELTETVRLDPANLEARQRQGDLLLRGNEEDLERALENAEAILASDPDRWEARLLQARALAGLGRREEAGVAFAEAVEAAPEEHGPLLLYASHLRRVGQKQEAEAALRRVTEIHPRFRSWLTLATFLTTEERLEEAEAAYRQGVAVAQPDERTEATSAIANFLLARERPDEAEQVLRSALDEDPQNQELIYALARFYHAAGSREQAEAMIQQAARTKPDDPRPFLLLSSYRAGVGDLPGALEAAESALAVAPDDELAKLRRAEVLIEIGVREGDEARIAAGTEAVDAVLVANPNLAEAGFVRAKVEIARQRYPEAIEALWRVVGARPGWAQAHYLLGTALLLSGEPAAARSEAVRSIELDAANPDAYRLLARSHARLGDHALAVKAAERALAAEPEDVATRVLVAESLVRERRFDEALGRLLAIPEAERGVDGNLALGRVYALRQEYDNARRYLLLALEASPGQPAVLMDLALVDARQDRLDESVVRVRAARDAAPDDPALQELYGDVVWAAGDTAEAQRAFERALALDANRQSTYAKLGRLLVFTGRTDEAIATHQHALEQGEGAGGLHLVLATLLETRGRADEAMAHYESAIEANPELAVAKNNLAYLLAERGQDLDRALELARAALEALPENPSFADTLGWVLYKKNLPGAAIGYLQQAVGGMPPSDPSLPLVRQHLALAYEANENPEQAIEALEQAVRELDALADPASGREPSWARDLRSQLERLREST